MSTLTTASPSFANRPHPHVTGHSRRVKADPTKLNRLAARIMCASGVFSAGRNVVGFRLGRFLSFLLLMSAAGTLAFADNARPTNDVVQLVGAFQPDGLLTLGVGEYRGQPDFVTAVTHNLDAQDRFEIARLFRMSSIAEIARNGRGVRPAQTALTVNDR